MEHYALVKVPVASIYLRPESPCELSDEALCGWTVEILEELPGGWCKVKTHYSYTGYMRRDCLAETAPGVEDLPRWWADQPKMLVIKRTADILDAPRVQGGCVETLTMGAWVSPTGPADENGWVPLVLCDGRRGYTKHSFLDELITSWDRDADKAERLREFVVAAAFWYMGSQYRWGGRTPLGIDCSGLCSQAYLMNGVIIHRDAHMKPEFCMKPIPREKMDRGDLIFFKGHVAMYLGNDRIIHSTGKDGSDGVVISSFDPNSPDYREDLANGILEIGSVFAE